jgi:hypothetical protein
MRGRTLLQLVSSVRAEVRQSTNVATGQNARPRIVELIGREYERLYYDHAWEFLKIYRDKVMQAGSRYYAFPTDLTLERILRVEQRHSGQWVPVEYGIGAAQYNAIDPEQTDGRMDPVRRWQSQENDQFEVWPKPASNGSSDGDGRVRFWGIKKFEPLVSNDDVCLLDDKLVVLFVASEYLSRKEGGPIKRAAADQLYAKLRGSLKKTGPIQIGGGNDGEHGDGERELRVTYARAD